MSAPLRQVSRLWLAALFAFVLISGCASGSSVPPEAQPIKDKYGSYSVQQAASDGYARDDFCLDAAAFGQPAQQGAMGYHATNESLLRGPIDANRPQALMFDGSGKVLGVEYEITADAVAAPPSLFTRTFTKLPPHAGVAHEHYALHLWFVENPSGPFADFNPKVTCPQGDQPAGGAHPAGH